LDWINPVFLFSPSNKNRGKAFAAKSLKKEHWEPVKLASGALCHQTKGNKGLCKITEEGYC